MERAFGRRTRLTADQLERGLVAVGGTGRLRRRLRRGEPVTLAAIGASNTVRGGCEPWQVEERCSAPKYSAGRRGWLLQAFDALNRSYPHPRNRLLNHGIMATGPEAFTHCLNSFVPMEADAVIISFADMCPSDEGVYLGVSAGATASAPLGQPHQFEANVESLVRGLLRRRPAPAVLLFNFFAHSNWNCAARCAFSASCDAALGEIARYYHTSTVSVRDALFLDATHGANQRYHWASWTQDNGKHATFGQGADFLAELLHFWVGRAASHSYPDATPDVASIPRLHAIPGVEGRDEPGSGTGHGGACYGFAGTFGGTIEKPRVLRSDGWRLVQSERSAFSGEVKHKPGYVATQRGAALLVDTVTPGVALQAGFLRTRASRAVARLSCVAPCRCSPMELHAFTNASTSTTEYSPVHTFHAEASCAFELRLVSDGETFKFVGLQVLL